MCVSVFVRVYRLVFVLVSVFRRLILSVSVGVSSSECVFGCMCVIVCRLCVSVGGSVSVSFCVCVCVCVFVLASAVLVFDSSVSIPLFRRWSAPLLVVVS